MEKVFFQQSTGDPFKMENSKMAKETAFLDRHGRFAAFISRNKQLQRAASQLRTTRKWRSTHPHATHFFSRRARIKCYVPAGVPVTHHYWMYPQNQQLVGKLCGIWRDEKWLASFQMIRQMFMEIVDMVQGDLEHEITKIWEAINRLKRVAVAIWYTANVNTYREVSEQFGMGVPTVRYILKEVCAAMEKPLYRKTVCLGPSMARIIGGFGTMDMPHCIGAIDRCHIVIHNPGGKVDRYGNWKNYSSILLQGTVDHTGRFIDSDWLV